MTFTETQYVIVTADNEILLQNNSYPLAKKLEDMTDAKTFKSFTTEVKAKKYLKRIVDYLESEANYHKRILENQYKDFETFLKSEAHDEYKKCLSYEILKGDEKSEEGYYKKWLKIHTDNLAQYTTELVGFSNAEIKPLTITTTL